jgi:hypothetical protein
MKTTLKTLLIASAFVFPASAYAQSGMGMMEGKQWMMMQCPKGEKECPMADKMETMQSNMGGMMSGMQGMMEKMKDPAMKEKMQKMHESMGDMMKNMQQMHEQMMSGGMMGDKVGMDKSPTGDSADHEKHHPAQ